MKTIRKSLIVSGLLVFSLGSVAQSAKIYKVDFKNEEIQLKVIHQFEKKTLDNKKDRQLINELGKKVILRRKGLNEK
jgi:hypothetical protein